MKDFLTMGDVALAAADDGMSVEQFFFESPGELFERVDWDNLNTSEPSELNELNELMERIDERADELLDAVEVFERNGLDTEDAKGTICSMMDKWCELFDERERKYGIIGMNVR